jgi:predicted glycosyltransferase
MLHEEDDLWLTEELPTEEPAELLRALPEIRQYFGPDQPEEEVGLRSILERPEALSKAWWREETTQRRRAKHRKRHSHVLRAA